jgi:hypothetical protein
MVVKRVELGTISESIVSAERSIYICIERLLE